MLDVFGVFGDVLYFLSKTNAFDDFRYDSKNNMVFLCLDESSCIFLVNQLFLMIA